MTTSKISLKSLMAENQIESDLWWHKSAQSQADEVQFEQDFSNLAFTFIQDRAPALMSYILGFETVDRSDDGTKAVGIFGFKIDDDYYYVPAFFMNNQVKGIESILAKKTNSFIPLTEEWINFIINRKATEIGNTDRSENEEDFENPNFDFLRRPTVGPLGGGRYYKDASAKDRPAWNGGLKYFPPEIKDGEETPWTFKQAWAVMKYRIGEGLSKDEGFKEAAAGLHDALTGNHSIFKEKRADSSPIYDYLRNVGGPRAVRTLFNAIGGNVKMANAAMEFYDKIVDLVPRSFPKTCLAIKQAQEAALLHTPPVTFTDKANDEDSAREVIEDGFTVVDKRDDDHTSYPVKRDYEKLFMTPDAPGVYDVLCEGGVTHKAYVMDMDRICRNGPSGGTILYFPDNDQVIITRRRWVVSTGDRKKSPKDIYDEAKSLGSIHANGDYIFVGPDGSCIGTFHVSYSDQADGGRVVLQGSLEDFMSSQARDLDDEAGMSTTGAVWGISPSSVELADFDGRPVSHGATLVMPRNWKVLEVKKQEPIPYLEGESWDDHRKRERKLHPEYRLGSLATLRAELRKQGAAEVDVRSDDGTEFYYRFDGNGYSTGMSYKQAAIDLVTRLGFRYKDARDLLKKAAVERTSHCLLKLGQLVGVDPRMPADQTPAADEYTGIPTYQTPYADETTGPFTNVELPPKDNVPGENVGGEMERDQEAAFDEEAAQLAQDAAQAGQKNVFDQATIGGLAKVYDTGAVVDSYLPEMMQAIDRLGRIMFLYYWKHDDFVERYGTDNVVEMEDVLRATFKQLGKLTLDLRKKAVGQGDAGLA